MKFLVDRMLGRLAKGLRMLGYDTVYYRGTDARQMLDTARREGRTILTRSAKLLPRKPEDRVLRVVESVPLLQMRELLQKKCIRTDEEKRFSRCLVCNTPLAEAPRETVEGRVPDFVFYQHEKFFECPQCLKIYWPGSHQERMKQRIEALSA